MLRYLISFPSENIRPEQLEMFREYLKAAADDREWRDIIVTHGGTITDMRQKPRPRHYQPKVVARRPTRQRRVLPMRYKHEWNIWGEIKRTTIVE